jgi:hypothetical protein
MMDCMMYFVAGRGSRMAGFSEVTVSRGSYNLL